MAADAQSSRKRKAARTHAYDTDEDDEGSVMDAVSAANSALRAANAAARRVAEAKQAIQNADNTQTIAAEVEKARTAMTAASEAIMDAEEALAAAMDAADEPVLGLFKAANAVDVEDDDAQTDYLAGSCDGDRRSGDG